MLLSAVLAVVTMRLIGTPVLDAGAYRLGVGVAAAGGLLVGFLVRAIHRWPPGRVAMWFIIPIAGALVAMAIQWILLARAPTERTYVLASGVTTGEPVTWVLAGAPFGAFPALVVAVVVGFGMRIVSSTPVQDARERVMLPFAAACAILGSLTLGSVAPEELPIAAGIVLVAALALVEITLRDRARKAWLERVFSGEDPQHCLVPITEMTSGIDLPHVVGAVRAEQVIVRIEEPHGYRGAARVPIATTGLVVESAIAPLRLRRNALVAALASTTAVGVVALLLR
jgi:hypothetical protein